MLNSNQYLTWNSGDHLSLSLLVSQADIALEHLHLGLGGGLGLDVHGHGWVLSVVLLSRFILPVQPQSQVVF